MSVVNDLDQRFVTLYPKATNFRHYIKISRYNCYRYSASVLMYYYIAPTHPPVRRSIDAEHHKTLLGVVNVISQGKHNNPSAFPPKIFLTTPHRIDSCAQ